jgi:serine protease
MSCLAAALLLSESLRAANTILVPADKATIQAAIDAATNGDTVLVAPGTYPEHLNFRGKTISLISEQGSVLTTIDGGGFGSVITMQSGEGPGTLVQGFTIARGGAAFGAGAWLVGTAPTFRKNIFLDNTQFPGGFGAAIAGFNGSPIIEENEFVGNSCVPTFDSGVMSFVNGSSPRIFNNLIHDNPCRAINLFIPSGVAASVFNNTIVRNQAGIYVDHGVSNSEHAYLNNVIAQNDIGLEVANETTPFDAVWRNNLVFANAVNFSGTSDSTGANGNVSADPRFVNAASGNFHLGRGSAAIDAGTSVGLSLPPTDFDGAERNQDGDGDGVAKIDIGAFEAAPPAIQASIPVPVDSRLWLMIAALAIMAMARQRLS